MRSTNPKYFYNANSQQDSMWNGSANTQVQGQYYWGSMPVAFYKNGQVHFQHQDWLGTERVRTTYNGATEGTFSNLPFGDAQMTASGSDLDPYHFAMLDSDSESGTDHAQYRQYSPAQGRWMRPDPYTGSYNFSNPQSFNRYVYALNNPLGLVDPLGLDANDDGCTEYPVLNEDGSTSDVTTCSVDGGGGDDSGDGGDGGDTGPESGSYGGAGGGTATNNNACTTQRIISGVKGAANLGLAIVKGLGLGAAVAGIASTGVGAPVAAVAAVYGTTSIFGQGLTGAAQLYSAITGNYGTPSRVEQIGSILSGPAAGIGTLLAGGSPSAAAANAGYENFITAGSGAVEAAASITRFSQGIPQMADYSSSAFGVVPVPANACGAGH